MTRIYSLCSLLSNTWFPQPPRHAGTHPVLLYADFKETTHLITLQQEVFLSKGRVAFSHFFTIEIMSLIH